MIQQINFGEGHKLTVETIGGEDLASLIDADGGLPEGARQVAKAADAASMLRSQLRAIGRLAASAVEEIQPDEIEVEAHIKFAGDVRVVPFIASTTGEGGLRVKATWRP